MYLKTCQQNLTILQTTLLCWLIAMYNEYELKIQYVSVVMMAALAVLRKCVKNNQLSCCI